MIEGDTMDIAGLAMMLESISARPVQEAEFKAAADLVAATKGLRNEQKLQFYALYKQATVGGNNTKRPGMLDFVGQKKWDAWNDLQGFPQESAAMAYVYFASQLQGGQGMLGSSARGDEPSEESGMKRGVSTFVAAEGDCGDDAWTEDEAVFRAVVDGDLARLETLLGRPDAAAKIAAKSRDGGMTPLHFAADRGDLRAARRLVEAGADPRALDDEGQTPADLAELCEHQDLVDFFSSL